MRTSNAWIPEAGTAWRWALCALVLTGAALPARAEGPIPENEAGFVAFLRERGLAAEAAGEVQRLALLDGAQSLDVGEAFELGLILARQGDLARAASLLELAAERTEQPELADQRRLALGTVLLKTGAYPRAARLFSRIETFGASDTVRSRATRLGCIGHVYGRDAAASRECVRGLLKVDGELLAESERLLRTLDIDPERRAVVGGVLSGLLPGLGQLIAGEPIDAGLALLLNGGWEAGTGVLLMNGAYMDAGLLALGFGIRYYVGNIEHGAAAWRAAAESKREKASGELVKLLAR